MAIGILTPLIVVLNVRMVKTAGRQRWLIIPGVLVMVGVFQLMTPLYRYYFTHSGFLNFAALDNDGKQVLNTITERFWYRDGRALEIGFNKNFSRITAVDSEKKSDNDVAVYPFDKELSLVRQQRDTSGRYAFVFKVSSMGGSRLFCQIWECHSTLNQDYFQIRYDPAQPDALTLQFNRLDDSNFSESFNYRAIHHEADETELETIRQKYTEKSEEYFAALKRLGSKYFDQLQLKDAEKMYQVAIDLQKDFSDKGFLFDSLNDMANLLTAQARWKEAMPIYRELVLLAKQLFGVSDPLVIRELKNLATVMLNAGEEKEMPPVLQEAFSLCKNNSRASEVCARLKELATTLKEFERD